MNSFGHFLKALEAQLSPEWVIAVLFGLTVAIGCLVGATMMGWWAAVKTRRKIRAAVKERKLLAKLLEDSRQHSARLQVEQDKLQTLCNGLDSKLGQRNQQIQELKGRLQGAEALVTQREREHSLLKDAFDAKFPPTLIKRVTLADEKALSEPDTGIIPDDQVIPTLPEAELTANVEAYDLSDLEELVNQDL